MRGSRGCKGTMCGARERCVAQRDEVWRGEASRNAWGLRVVVGARVRVVARARRAMQDLQLRPPRGWARLRACPPLIIFLGSRLLGLRRLG